MHPTPLLKSGAWAALSFGYPTKIEIRPHPKQGGTILTLAIQKVSQFPLIFDYRKNVAKVRSASFHLHKRLLKSFGRSVEIWYNFSKRSDFGVPRLLAAERFSTRRSFVLGMTALHRSISTSSHGRCPAHLYEGLVPNNDAGKTSVPSVDSAVKMSRPSLSEMHYFPAQRGNRPDHGLRRVRRP